MDNQNPTNSLQCTESILSGKSRIKKLVNFFTLLQLYRTIIFLPYKEDKNKFFQT